VVRGERADRRVRLPAVSPVVLPSVEPEADPKSSGPVNLAGKVWAVPPTHAPAPGLPYLPSIKAVRAQKVNPRRSPAKINMRSMLGKSMMAKIYIVP